MSDENCKEANPSQLVGHLEVRLPASVGSRKVQPHSIRQISETATGGQKIGGVLNDERARERGQMC